jgi:hypothetical protein
MNPYVRASIAKQQRDRALRLPPAQSPEMDGLSERSHAFMEATAINHGGNRAKVCTAIAGQMTEEQIRQTIAVFSSERKKRAAKLRSLDAPAVIVENEERETPHERLLARVLAKRTSKQV